MLPAVRADFGVDSGLAQLAFSVAMFTMAFMTLVYGVLSDRYGRRPVLLSGLGLFLVGCTLSASAPSIEFLVAGRMVQGIGAAAGVTVARAIARDVFGADKLVSAIAYLTMAYTLGPALAPPIGGTLSDLFGWRAVLWFGVIAGTAIGAAVFFVLDETHTVRAPKESRIGLFAGIAILVSNVRFTAFVLASGFQSGAFFSQAAGSTFLMKDYLGRSATEFGLYFLFFPAGYSFGNFVSTRLSGRVSIETMVLAGSLILGIAVALEAAFIVTGNVTPLTVFFPGFILTMAQGLSLPNAQAGAINVNPSLAGTASGIGVFLQFFCGALFSQISGLLADGTPYPMILCSAAGAVLALVAGAATYLLARRPRG